MKIESDCEFGSESGQATGSCLQAKFSLKLMPMQTSSPVAANQQKEGGEAKMPRPPY